MCVLTLMWGNTDNESTKLKSINNRKTMHDNNINIKLPYEENGEVVNDGIAIYY